MMQIQRYLCSCWLNTSASSFSLPYFSLYPCSSQEYKSNRWHFLFKVNQHTLLQKAMISCKNWFVFIHIVVEVTKMGFEKGDNCEAYQLGKAESTSVGRSTPTWWLPICCPCNKTTLLESGFIDRYGKKIGIIIFLLKHNSILLDTWQQDSPCGTFLCHTAPLVEP